MVEGKSELEEIGDLSNKEKIALQRRYVLHCKYEEAVEMYADSKLPLCKIAVKCNVSLGGLGSYLRRYWRELILRRRGISYEGKDPKDIKIVSSGQPSIVSKAKYAEAVEACKSLEYIDLNVSQVARKFNVNGTALANYMRLHYEEIPIWRENVRRMLGIGDNVHRGVRPECEEQYVLAVEMYKSTDKTIPEIAEICQVSIGGLSQHMRFYHKEVIRKRKAERKAAKKNRIIGKICGNGQIHCPQQKTVEKYREALELYKNSNLIIKEIVGNVIDAFEQNKVEYAYKTEPLEELVDIYCDEMKMNHVKRVQKGECTLHQGFIFNDLLTDFERIADHCSNVAVAIIELELNVFDTHEYLINLKKDDGTNFDKYFEEYKEMFPLSQY